MKLDHKVEGHKIDFGSPAWIGQMDVSSRKFLLVQLAMKTPTKLEFYLWSPIGLDETILLVSHYLADARI